MRYNSVDDAIADYKKAYGLMWDTRSIIVKFRRKEGNAYLPEELKTDVKKVKEEANNAAQVEKEQNANHVELKPNVNESKKEDGNGQMKENKVNHANKSSANQDTDSMKARLQDNSSKVQNTSASQVQENANSHSSLLPTSVMSNKIIQEQQQLWVIDIKSVLLSCIMLQLCANNQLCYLPEKRFIFTYIHYIPVYWTFKNGHYEIV